MAGPGQLADPPQPMTIKIELESAAALSQYSQVPIAFWVRSQLRVELIDNGLGGIHFSEEAVTPYLKDYDALPGESPIHWPERWDVSRWGFLAAFDGRRRVGGAAIAWQTKQLYMLDERDDLAVVWDLRVHPDYRGQGVGHLLFSRASQWAAERQCNQLKVETQNINVPACRFYGRQGCQLGGLNRYIYHPLNEVQLLWYKTIP